MEQIDGYVNLVYRHIDGDKEEIEILKEEMRNVCSDVSCDKW